MRPFEAEEEALAQMVHICAQEEFLKAYRGQLLAMHFLFFFF